MRVFRRFIQWWAQLMAQMRSGSEFLCDTCRYDHGNACTRPERPNATQCPDYKRR